MYISVNQFYLLEIFFVYFRLWVNSFNVIIIVATYHVYVLQLERSVIWTETSPLGTDRYNCSITPPLHIEQHLHSPSLLYSSRGRRREIGKKLVLDRDANWVGQHEFIVSSLSCTHCILVLNIN